MNTKTVIIAIIFLLAGIILEAGFELLPQNQTNNINAAGGITYAPNDWKLWENGFVGNNQSYWGYSIKYPRDFELKAGDYATGQSLLDENPTQIVMPDDAFSNDKTNFGGAWLSISYNIKTSESECLKPIENPNGTPEQNSETIGSLSFKTQNLSEAAAGNIYRTKLYRAFVNGVCLEIDQTLHTGNIANYTPGAVKEFDTTKTDKIFNALLETLSITNKNPFN